MCAGQGLLHDAVHPRPVRADGLPEQESDALSTDDRPRSASTSIPPRPARCASSSTRRPADTSPVEGMPDEAGFLVTEDVARGEQGREDARLLPGPARPRRTRACAARARELERPAVPARRPCGLIRRRDAGRRAPRRRAGPGRRPSSPGSRRGSRSPRRLRPLPAPRASTPTSTWPWRSSRAVFTVAPWGHRILTPWVASALPVRNIARAFRIVTFAGLVAAGGVLFLYLRALGHGMPAAIARRRASSRSCPRWRECLRYVFLAEPVAVLLEIVLLVALQSGRRGSARCASSRPGDDGQGVLRPAHAGGARRRPAPDAAPRCARPAVAARGGARARRRRCAGGGRRTSRPRCPRPRPPTLRSSPSIGSTTRSPSGGGPPSSAGHRPARAPGRAARGVGRRCARSRSTSRPSR